jgi:hypothetical protein
LKTFLSPFLADRTDLDMSPERGCVADQPQRLRLHMTADPSTEGLGFPARWVWSRTTQPRSFSDKIRRSIEARPRHTGTISLFGFEFE